MDHDLRTLSACTLGFIPHEALRALTRARPLVAEPCGGRLSSMSRSSGSGSSTSAGVARRLAHLVLELREKLAVVGRCRDNSFELPMTQLDLADALGLTPVHVNRVLQSLRNSGILDMKKRTVNLADPTKLKSLGDFDALYLHPARTPDASERL
jgi:CRP-like cAMP-binding protein